MRGLTLILLFSLAYLGATVQLRSETYKVGAAVALDDLNVVENHNGVFVYNIVTTGATIAGLDSPLSVTTVNDTQVVYNYEWLNITGQYWHNGTLLFLLPVLGDGNFEIDAQNVTVTFTGTSASYTSFFFTFAFTVQFDKFFGGGLMDVLTDVLGIQRVAADVIFKYFRDNIATLIQPVFN